MIAWWEVGLRLILAAALSGVIGVNREHHEWAAGLRTHMLVCVGAALTMLVSTYGFQDVLGRPAIVLDPSRIAAQVISGIGFLGAGTILFLQREQVIRGLTTAAGLWAVAAVGLASGAGMYLAATLGTALMWIILAILKPLERRYLRRNFRNSHVRLRLAGGTPLARLEEAIADAGLEMSTVTLRRDGDGLDVVELECDPPQPRAELLTKADALRRMEGVVAVEVGNLNAAAAPDRQG